MTIFFKILSRTNFQNRAGLGKSCWVTILKSSIGWEYSKILWRNIDMWNSGSQRFFRESNLLKSSCFLQASFVRVHTRNSKKRLTRGGRSFIIRPPSFLLGRKIARRALSRYTLLRFSSSRGLHKSSDPNECRKAWDSFSRSSGVEERERKNGKSTRESRNMRWERSAA